VELGGWEGALDGPSCRKPPRVWEASLGVRRQGGLTGLRVPVGQPWVCRSSPCRAWILTENFC
jgi:hypothetical protein